jgi:hypothetical protein
MVSSLTFHVPRTNYLVVKFTAMNKIKDIHHCESDRNWHLKF